MGELTPLRVRGIETHPVILPMDRPIRTASGTVSQAPLLLVDLQTEEGIIGRSYLFAYHAFLLKPLNDLVLTMAEMLKGDLVVPVELDRKLRSRFALFGTRNLVALALSGLDIAAWDIAAAAVGVPLVAILGGQSRPIRAYVGNGIGVIPVDEVPDEARKLAALGFSAVKIRLGRSSFADDLAAVRAARHALPDEVALMADFNQALGVEEAIHRGQILDGEGLYWMEEPVRADDFRGCAEVAAAVRTPVQIGENFESVFEMHEALYVSASDFVMVDAQRIGGVTGWVRAAGVAQTFGRPLSSHLFQEVSAHLLAVSPTGEWLEYMNVADPVLAEPLKPSGGVLTASSRPGVGLLWDEAAVRRYRMA